jgi:hypothetical protein
MRAARLVLSLLCILFSFTRLNSQQPAPTPQRDPQAISVFNQLVTATGWGSYSPPVDAVISAKATENVVETQSPISLTLKVKGCHEFRIDAKDTTGGRSSIVHGDSAANFTSSGSRTVPAHSALSLRPLALPFFCGIGLPLASNISLRYLGTEDVGGQPAQKIESSQASSPNDPLGTFREKTSRLTIWVSAATGLPIQIASIRASEDNPSASVTTIRTFSDYRLVNGTAVPFHQEEWIGERLLHTLQISSVTFNNGLSDADFTLPVVQP